MTDTTTKGTGLTLLWPAMELHVAGCADIERSVRRHRTTRGENVESRTTYRGSDIVRTIVKADTDMAGAFCEDPYTESSRENGCWSFETCHIAPCVKPLLRGVTFDKVTGKPEWKDGK